MRIEENAAIRENAEHQNLNAVNNKDSSVRDLAEREEGREDTGRRPLAELLKSEYEVNFQLSFSFHKETERLVVQVIDPETSEIIRQIPPEELLELAVKLQEMIGFLLDQRI